MPKTTILWVLVLSAGAGLLVYGAFFQNKLAAPAPGVSVSLSPGPGSPNVASPQPTGNFGPEPSPVASYGAGTAAPAPAATFRSFVGLKEPASCRVGGEINYLSPDIFESKEALITWKNIDSGGRLIKWKIQPDDKLAVGPNLFANLTVPDGEYRLTVGLPEKPAAKEYTLTAIVTYGELVNEAVVVKDAPCTGKVKVKINF